MQATCYRKNVAYNLSQHIKHNAYVLAGNFFLNMLIANCYCVHIFIFQCCGPRPPRAARAMEAHAMCQA